MSNPFANFRKYQKVWIAGTIFLCMITFVLCSGLGSGGTEDWLTSYVYRMFGSGSTVVKINGRNISDTELRKLETHRNIANDYMKEACKILVEQVDLEIQQAKKEKKQSDQLKQRMASLEQIKFILKEKTTKDRYFGSGVEVQELVDFMVWHDKASEMEINLVDESVRDELYRQLLIPFVFPGAEATKFYGDQVEKKTLARLYDIYQKDVGNYSEVIDAVRAEFEVGIAKMALAEVRPEAVTDRIQNFFQLLSSQVRYSMTPQQLWEKYKEQVSSFDVALIPIDVAKIADSIKEQPSKAQMETLFDKYKGKRYSPATDTPGFVPPESFELTWVTVNPKSQAMRDIAHAIATMEQFPPAFYQPSLGGFGPGVRYSMATPSWQTSMKQDYAKRLEQISTAIRYVQVPLTDPHFRLPIATFEFTSSPEVKGGEKTPLKLENGKLTSVGLAATLVGGSIMPDAMPMALTALQLAGYDPDSARVKESIAIEVQRRAPIPAALIGSLADQSALTGLSQWYLHSVPGESEFGGMQQYFTDLLTNFQSKNLVFMPFPVVEPGLQRDYELQVATGLAKDIMQKVRRELMKVKGEAGEVKARVLLLQKEFPALEINQSTGMRNRWNVAKDPALEDLFELYKEYVNPENQQLDINRYLQRSDPKNRLTEDDFYKLFIDSNEDFSVANAGVFVPQPWPPTINMPNAAMLVPGQEPSEPDPEAKKGIDFDLWTLADQTVLFWKSKYELGSAPENLESAKDDIIRTWRFQKARDLALERAKSVANDIIKVRDNVIPKEFDKLRGNLNIQNEQIIETLKRQLIAKEMDKAVQDEVAKLNVDAIALNNVASKQKIQTRQGFVYVPYEIPKDVVPYPRKDASKQILSLNDLKSPLTTVDADPNAVGNDRELDSLNKQLFQKKIEGPARQQIQVLTNLPRSMYYVAVITKKTPVTMQDFMFAYRMAQGQFTGADSFVRQAQMEGSEVFMEQLTQQLRTEAKYEPVDLESFRR